ncbi:DUF4112 domain-containing protein [Oceaniglobus roseus]|uniref:DUF4112 domain-containing protein n=1 Tax=Oceaniglobus roseus TaxID=1737570 RepID=UPI000C7EE39C|nr:DUF4112 domain-containing protein [Kandeliimicrobium roseum]
MAPASFDHDDHQSVLDQADRIARLLDARFRLFGIRFGFDSIIGLIPGVGDLLVAAPSAWMVVQAHRLGLPKDILLRMAANIGVDVVMGSVPILGDILDIGFKANLRNARLLREGIERARAEAGMPRPDARAARRAGI